MPGMPHRIRTRLFVVILGVNALLAGAAYVAISASFDQEFRQYVAQQTGARLALLAEALGRGYARSGGWQWLVADRDEWQRLVREHGPARIGTMLGDVGRAAVPDADSKAAPRTAAEARGSGSRTLLLDADRTILIGRTDTDLTGAQIEPVAVGRRTVGYVAYLPPSQLLDAIDRVFARQQDRNFIVVAIGMLASSLLLAAGIAAGLDRRLRELVRGTRALARGDYDTRIAIGGRDEFALLAADFNALASTLEATRQARQQWVADVSHELRTPLAVLRGEIEALQDGVRRLDPASLASLAEEVAQLSRLVDDLHTLSLSDVGALEYRRQPIALDALIEDALDGARPELARAGIEVTAELGPDVHVFADRTRMGQLFANLLQNTLRYTDRPGRLAVRLRAEGGCARIEWEDSNPGVTDADLPRLTERLYRAESSRSRASGGSGLGLAIAGAIVAAHQGTMRAAHGALGGLRWTLEFPVCAAEAPVG